MNGFLRILTIAGLLSLTAFGGATEAAGATLRIRLVQALPTEADPDPALRDIAPLLRRSLNFQGYRLSSQATLTVPPGGNVRLGPYRITCQGTPRNLQIVIATGSRTIMNTTAAIEDGQPLLLGGFPAGHGIQNILVFSTR